MRAPHTNTSTPQYPYNLPPFQLNNVTLKTFPKADRLIRFRANNKSGAVKFGEAILPKGETGIEKAIWAVFTNNRISKKVAAQLTKRISKEEHIYDSLKIKELLCPLAHEHVHTIRCLGLNYARHAAEANLPLPKYPSLFYKPVTALAGPSDPIRVPLIAQEPRDNPQIDFEAELVVMIGKPCRDVSESGALDYVHGYCVGNDVSQRVWQLERGGGQWGLGKAYDGWAPIGPGIVSTKVIKDPQNLDITTRVNGKLVQRSNTRDMVFSVRQIVSFLSQGTTLLPGDLIFTGTPQGVGMSRKPPLWLKDGDFVSVHIEGIGKCRNQIIFEKKELN